jgi:hypothetical protein
MDKKIGIKIFKRNVNDKNIKNFIDKEEMRKFVADASSKIYEEAKFS